MKKGALSHLAVAGGEIRVWVTPKASRNAIEQSPGGLRIYVTTAPEGGKANVEVRKLLAKALAVAPSSLSLVRGQNTREKVFRLDA